MQTQSVSANSFVLRQETIFFISFCLKRVVDLESRKAESNQQINVFLLLFLVYPLCLERGQRRVVFIKFSSHENRFQGDLSFLRKCQFLLKKHKCFKVFHVKDTLRNNMFLYLSRCCITVILE